VRVHTDPSAAASATALGATAYTLGQSIVFGPGRYSPETVAGRRLVAHELTHVAQQGMQDGGGSGSVRVDPSPAAEAEAAEAARVGDVAGGTGTSTLHPVGGVAIQRQTTEEENKPKTQTEPPSSSTTAALPATTPSPPGNATQAPPPRRVIDTSSLRDWQFRPYQSQRSPDSAEPKNAGTLPHFPGLPQWTPAPELGPTPPTSQLAPEFWRDPKQPEKQPEQKGLMDWLTSGRTPPLYSNPDLPTPMQPGSPPGQFIPPGPLLQLDPQFRPDFQLYRDLMRLFK